MRGRVSRQGAKVAKEEEGWEIRARAPARARNRTNRIDYDYDHKHRFAEHEERKPLGVLCAFARAPDARSGFSPRGNKRN